MMAKVLRCFNCHSTKHLSNKCPYPRGNDSHTQDIHIILFNAKPDKAMSALIKETLGMAVLDSACTKAVTGETWLNLFIDTLTEEDKKLVNIRPSDMNFRFGDGIEVNSTEIVKFPVVIGTKKIMIEQNIVKNDIPLLFSRASMKKAEMVLDFETDTAEVLGNKSRSSLHFFWSLLFATDKVTSSKQPKQLCINCFAYIKSETTFTI